MAGFRQKVNWFSPRAIKEPTSRVVEEQIAPNSFRYRVKKQQETNRLETPMMDQGLSYETYKAQKSKKERKRNHNHNQWAEDAYGDDVMVHYNSPKYAWQPTRWSNWSYGSFLSIDSDDNADMFVKEPENYLTPTVAQIKAKTNYWTSADMKRIKELSRVCYLKMIDDPDYIHEDYENPNDCNMSPDEWKKKKETYDNVYTTFIPGFTPLEQAIAVNHKINDMLSKENRKQSDRGGNSARSYEFRRSDYADPRVNSQLEMNTMNKAYKLDILNRISIMGDLGSQFKVERAIGEQEVGYSDMHKTKLMNNYDQIRMIDMYQRMLHGYNLKFLTKSLIVDVPVQSSEKKQKIVILLDFSGSMNDTQKQIWVNSILVDRFRYVMKGEAEVFFSYFVSNTDFLRFKHVKNEQDVERFWKWFSNSPNGSYTNIGRNVTYVAEQIKKGKLCNLDIDLSKELPEILIINDGEDEVGYDSFPYKVNAISLLMFSEELKKLCVASGGKQVMIYKSQAISAYSSSGMEVISE